MCLLTAERYGHQHAALAVLLGLHGLRVSEACATNVEDLGLLGAAPSTVESVRLDPELKDRLARRAEEEGVPVSEVIREALRHHLEASRRPAS